MNQKRDIYGYQVCVRTDDAVIAAGAQEILGPFPMAEASSAPVLEITMSAVRAAADIPFSRSDSTIVIGEMPRRDIGLQGTLLRDGERWIIDCGVALIILDPAAGRAQGWLVQPEKQIPNFHPYSF